MFGLTLFFMSQWYFIKEFNLPMGFFDFLIMFGMPLCPVVILAVLLLLVRHSSKQIKSQTRLQRVILSQARLERVNSKSNEVVLFKDIKSVKVKCNFSKEVTPLERNSFCKHVILRSITTKNLWWRNAVRSFAALRMTSLVLIARTYLDAYTIV